jgi:hypothetical protein
LTREWLAPGEEKKKVSVKGGSAAAPVLPGGLRLVA